MAALALEKLLDRGEVWLAERQAESQIGSRAPADLCHNLAQSIAAQSIAKFASFGVTKISTSQINLGQVDSDLPYGGLPCGAIHEWFLSPQKTPSTLSRNKNATQAPHTIITTLAANFFKEITARDPIENEAKRFILWIGKSVWPTPFLLNQVLGQEFFGNCAFIDPPRGKVLLWAVETALRSPASVAVIAACPNISFATSRRLSIAAQKGGGLGLIIRNASEISKPAMASSRWLLESSPSDTTTPAWRLSLLKYKGGLPKKNQWII